MDDRLDARQKLAILVKGVETLPPQCRRVFVLRKINGFSHKEIAERLGVSVKSVEKHLTAGALKCADYLRSQGFDPTDFVADGAWKPAAEAHHPDRDASNQARDE